MTLKRVKPIGWTEKFRWMLNRWRRDWRKHHAHREHRGTRRKP